MTRLFHSRHLSRRRLLAGILGVFLVLGFAGTAYTVEVVTTTVPVGRTPVSVAVNPLSHTTYVTNFFGDSVTVLDGAAEAVTATVSLPRFSIPNAVVVDSLSSPAKAYVANFWGRSVSIIEEQTLSLVGRIYPLGVHAGGPRALAIDPTSSPPKLYVASYGSGTVSVIDLTDNTLIKEISVGGAPRALAISASAGRRRVYAADARNDRVAVIDGATDTLISRLPVGRSPKAIAVDSQRGYAYVTSEYANVVTVIDDTDAVAATIPVGSVPRGIAVDETGRRGFVANFSSNTVSVLDLDANTVTATISVGTNPFSVCFEPVTGKTYVTDYGSDQLSVIQPDLTVENVTVGDRPYAVAVDGSFASPKAFVTNSGSHSVSIVQQSSSPLATLAGPQPAYAAPNPAVLLELDSATTSDSQSGTLLTGRGRDLRSPYASGIVAVYWRAQGESTWKRATLIEGAGTPEVRWEALVPPGLEAVQIAAVDEASAVSASSDYGSVAQNAGLAAFTRFDLSHDAEPPDVTDVTAEPTPLHVGEPLRISAIADDRERGGSAIASAEYQVDDQTWAPMRAADGAFDTSLEDVFAETSIRSAGIIAVRVRATDVHGNVTASDSVILPVVDPAAGRVTGGGWMEVPSATGPDQKGRTRLTFGLTARYDKKQDLRGNFQGQIPGLGSLRSSSLDWLVIEGDMAVLAGRGTLDGAPCNFVFSAREGHAESDCELRLYVQDEAGESVFDSGGDADRWWLPAESSGKSSVAIHRSQASR